MVRLDTIPDASPVSVASRSPSRTCADVRHRYAGHALNISQSAGVIDGFAFILFDGPERFDVAIDAIEEILRVQGK